MKTLPLIAVVAAAALSACTPSPQATTDALEAQGYRDIKLGGWAMFGCGEDDTFKRTWRATGQNGQRYKGVACSAFLKGVTVRQTGRG